MIKVIILDIGNVLVHFGWKKYLEKQGYDEDMISRIAHATVFNPLWKELDRSKSETIPEELKDKFCAMDPEITQDIRKYIDHSFEVVWEYDYAVDFIKTLKENGYLVYLLSNYGKANFKYAKENFKFFPFVDGQVISYELNHVKPEPEIYQYLIEKYHIKPKEAVFLDDMKENIEAAKPFGFHTILFTGLENAIGKLNELGVNI